MSPADLLGGAILAALVLYALFGGADYGGGIWDLLASGARKREQRALIERAIGPIWEANHVWLILVVVLLFTGFPAAFAVISVELFVPLLLLLVGIVLRGAAFTFRAYDRPDDRVQAARWGLLFSVSSLLAPMVLGIMVGALASGRLDAGTHGAATGAWLTPFPVVVGLLAVALFAYLAGTYLAVEATGELRDDFRRRAAWAGLVVVVLAALAAALSRSEAPLVFQGLTRRAWSAPLVLGVILATLVVAAGLRSGRVRLARAAAALQVALIVAGWGAAQHPYLVVPGVTLASASAPRVVHVAVLWALAAGGVLLFPALYLLLRIFKGERPLSVVDRRG